MNRRNSMKPRWCGLVLLALLAIAQSGCSTTDGMSAVMPDDARVSTGRVGGKQYLTTVVPQSSETPSASIGAGGISGGGVSGVGLGAGLSFDLSRLFERQVNSPVRVYRYGVQLPDGSKRDVDSPLDLQPGNCVNVIDSSRPGYPRLARAGEC
ncbi:hypothetical protein B0G69_1359 [Paraburkholderia sp. RAU2J]|uniref:hypothetical protein n=1 Tax=Paraburkholderia sp. RAU2J TaxID=1938810 RepID=UPI000F1A8260|nr:hypothetical protein [Paraburkholderia sp. RAU2J]RKT25639.1 hypothetical protein B0G69_1359 [Paraburkholderia sp. RAU2J]